MRILYRSQHIRKVCTNRDYAVLYYGSAMSRKIHMRIDQIQKIPNVDMLMQNGIGRCHPLIGNRKNQYAMDLIHPYRLVFKKVDNCLDLEIVKIIDIVDYH